MMKKFLFLSLTVVPVGTGLASVVSCEQKDELSKILDFKIPHTVEGLKGLKNTSEIKRNEINDIFEEWIKNIDEENTTDLVKEKIKNSNEMQKFIVYTLRVFIADIKLLTEFNIGSGLATGDIVKLTQMSSEKHTFDYYGWKTNNGEAAIEIRNIEINSKIFNLINEVKVMYDETLGEE